MQSTNIGSRQLTLDDTIAAPRGAAAVRARLNEGRKRGGLPKRKADLQALARELGLATERQTVAQLKTALRPALNPAVPAPRGAPAFEGAQRLRRIAPDTMQSVAQHGRYHKAQRSWAYNIPTGETNSYPAHVRHILQHAWERLPPAFQRGCKVYLSYGFESIDGLPTPSWVSPFHALVRSGDDEKVLKSYRGHDMTSMGEAEADGAETVVRSLDGLMALGLLHLQNRANLKELYDDDGQIGLSMMGMLGAALGADTPATSAYRQPVNFTISFWKLRIDGSEALGDKTSWLLREVLHQNNAKKGDCVFQCMVDQFANGARSPLKDTIQQIREKCGMPTGGVSLEAMGHIEQTFRWKGTNVRSQERSLGFCVFDHRLNLRRLPPYRERDSNYKHFCNIVAHNGHAYAFRDDRMAADRMRQSISYFSAVLRVARDLRQVEKKGPGGHDHSELYKDAYELFRETQHLQPDVGAIQIYLNEKLGRDVCSEVVKYKATDTQNTWIPAFDKPQQKVIPQFIAAKGLEIRCAELGIQLCNAPQRMGELKEMGLTFPERTFDMDNVVSMDIETCSVADSEGRFMTYAVGWLFKGEYRRLVAETEAELESNTILWRAIQEWQALAEQLPPLKGDKPAPLYIYAHNGSRFDAVAAIQAILAHSDEVPTDQLESNGKFISFTFGQLVFRDSCLITMSSLKAAANSYGVKASKGYLPHGYLQNCASTTELLERLNRDVPWSTLEPYMNNDQGRDWFTDVNDDGLHERKADRTWEQWRDEQPLRKAFEPEKICRFRPEMEEYLEQDVRCLHEIVQAVGEGMARDYGADIRTKCTLGSLAEHVWMHTLLKRIPKLETEEQHLRWQHANRGGFCGPLAAFDTTSGKKAYDREVADYEMRKALGEDGEPPSLQYIYKVDITSLYPASAGPIEFVTNAGVQKPLEKYYTGFPDPTRGWLQHDFAGVEMTKEHYEQLKDMHGLVRITFDQSSLKFPFFVKKMTHGTWGTLAPVMKATEAYTTPHVRMAFDYGVKVWLHDCEYTLDTMEPYGDYMAHFANMKNGADAIKKLAEKELKGATPERKAELELIIRKAEYDRSLAKLFLNGLLGRNNMKIARGQTLITKSSNDVVHCLGDGLNFQKADIVPFNAGEQEVLRVKFQEGGYDDHIQQFNVAPYLSGYMLGYSKMLMQCTFQYIAEIGAEALYTDTDSVAFRATPEQWKLYEDRFVPIKKTFGGMELEDTCSRLITIGPKKYACVHENGDYHWNANGMPARCNTKVDVLDRYEKVLGGSVESVDYFSITAGSDFELRHTTGATKKLRFICLKGAVENDRIRWWKDEQEFAEHAGGLKPVGWIDYTPEQKKENQKGKRAETVEKVRQTKLKESPETAHRVYILRNEADESYVGYSPDPERRLLQHNGVLPGGAACTRGRQWVLTSLYGGFKDKRAALKFESALQDHQVRGPDDWLDIARNLIETREAFASVHSAVGAAQSAVRS